eukprot:CAMPEP_0198556408 /NCGR_PEP_ID=MMETSP1462-20131121/86718_1 /TAXON_ID=1333877 /ORGANISM="Brandtodinium nutriculum, Strain RCC3387" /LENGTH=68 /DNA_ID=CAMNT_0044287157 /DNA_START=14 /DNA_END=217 /DNA_ORIENTATION=-
MAAASGTLGSLPEVGVESLEFIRQASVFSNVSRHADPEELMSPEVFSRQCTEIDDMARSAAIDEGGID